MAERDDDKSRDDMEAIPLQNEDSMLAGSVESIDVLIRRAQDGDSRAFEAVYRQTSDRVYALCLRMSGDADRAAELVQDVFVRVWERLASFRGDALFTTWLHRLTVNVVLQDRRTRGCREAREVSAPDLERFGRAAKRAMPGTRIDIERSIAGHRWRWPSSRSAWTMTATSPTTSISTLTPISTLTSTSPTIATSTGTTRGTAVDKLQLFGAKSRLYSHT